MRQLTIGAVVTSNNTLVSILSSCDRPHDSMIDTVLEAA
jgi:hypothetical protein